MATRCTLSLNMNSSGQHARRQLTLNNSLTGQLNSRRSAADHLLLLTMFKFPTSALIKRLLDLRKRSEEVQDEEEEWSYKAVKCIVKKLKKDRAVQGLEDALKTQDAMTECVKITINAEADASGGVPRGGMPHVIACRLWRYPDLRSHHQLKGLDHCQYNFDQSRSEVCVNPFHYSLIQTPDIPPVLVPITQNSELPPHHLELSDEGRISPLSLDRVDMDTTRSTPTPPGPVVPARGAEVTPPLTPVLYNEPSFWCTISYYELGQRVGEAFHASQPSIIIDGFTDPSNPERFCLGLLSNVNRNPVVDLTRRFIGMGARIYYVGGEVYVECLSESAIFVQSPIINRGRSWPMETVTKVSPGQNLKIFSNLDFALLLSQSVDQGFEATYGLTKMTTIRISFVKGWGALYRRQAVTATPCWIEIHLNGPLQWLDRVLIQMGSPAMRCSSMT